MNVNEMTLRGMLDGITDPSLRARYGAIISGKYRYEVYCLNPQKNPITGKPFHAKKCLIGYISQDNQIIDQQIIDKQNRPIAGIETSRDRFDGRKGFRCYCGNSSIVAPEEKGIITSTPPIREDLVKIHDNLTKSNKGQLLFTSGWAEYDSFGLKEVQS